MNTDIRVSVDFWEHPKTLKLIRSLGIEAPVALQRLWMYAAKFRPDGVLSDLETIDVAEAARWNGDPDKFVKALLDRGWLDKEDGIYIIHDWPEHQPWVVSAPERSRRAKCAINARWEKERSKNMQNIPGVYDENTPSNTDAIRMPYGCSTQNTPSPSPSPKEVLPERSRRAKCAINARWEKERSKNMQNIPGVYDENTPSNTDAIRMPYGCSTQNTPSPSPSPKEVLYDSVDLGVSYSETLAPTPENGSDPEAPTEATETFILIPTNRSKIEYPVTEAQVKEFENLYPAVDVRQELRNMRGWSISKPKKRKTYSGMLGFVNSWLSKEQDKGPRPSTRDSPYSILPNFDGVVSPVTQKSLVAGQRFLNGERKKQNGET